MNRQFHIIIKSVMALLCVISIMEGGQIVLARELTEGPNLKVLQSEQPEQPLAVKNNAENVELLGHLGGMAQAIEVRWQYAYVGFGPEFAILDVTDPAHIQRVGWMLAAGEVKDIAIQGDYAYIAYHGQNTSGSLLMPGMQVVDIRHPAIPVSLAIKEFYDCGFMESVEVQGNSAYFAFEPCSAFGGIIMGQGVLIHRLNITIPADPVILDTYENSMVGSIGGIVASPGWLYAVVGDANGSNMVVFDVSSPVSIIEVASVPSPAFYYYDNQDHIALSGDYALTAVSNLLQVADVSDPTQPTSIITHTLPGGSL